jgi:PAS domain S-box-containing protein
MSLPSTPLRVLLVDDRDENLIALSATLRECGAVLDLARSGPEALERLLEREYAAAVVDVQMPEMDGFELVRLMRGAERTKHTPVIFVTAGELSAPAEVRGYDAGAVDYIRKPYDPHALRSKVSVFVELHRQRQELLESARLLRDAGRRVEDSEALLDGIVEASPVGIGFVDRDLRYRRVNGALARMDGLPREAHLGRRIVELLPALPGDELEAVWRRVIASGEPVVDLEISGKVPTDDAVRTWRSTYYPVRQDGAVIGLALLVRDVTEEKRAAELQQLLIGIVGHDLRNPLSTVLTAASLLENPALPPAGRERNVRRIRDAGRRMEEIVRNVLDYTRARVGGGIGMNPAPTHIAEVLRTIAEDCAAAYPGRAVRVSGGGAGEGCWDVARLQQVFGNLATNALKYGREDAAVELRWRGLDDAVQIDVANEGNPIPAEAQARIFEPLSQLAAGGTDRSGLGLGLFIAREIVRAHDGTISVRSDASGTVFSVRLPRECAGAERPEDDLLERLQQVRRPST